MNKLLLTMVVSTLTIGAATAQTVLKYLPPPAAAPIAFPPAFTPMPPAGFQPVELGAMGPSLASARLMGETIAARNAELVQLSKDVLKPVTFTRNATRLAELQRIDDLRKGFKEAMIAAHQIDELAITLIRSYRHAEHEYGAAAQSFRLQSEDFTDARLKERTLALAEHYEVLKANCPAQKKLFEDVRKNMPGTLALLRDTGLYLDIHFKFIASYPEAVVPDAILEANIVAMKRHLTGFEAFESMLEKVQRAK